jgi:hypothetical protein
LEAVMVVQCELARQLGREKLSAFRRILGLVKQVPDWHCSSFDRLMIGEW